MKSESNKPFNQTQRPTGRRLNTDKIAEFIPTEDGDEQKTKNGTPNLLPKGLFRQEPIMPQETEDAKSDDPLVVSSGDSENDDVFYNDNGASMKDDGSRWAGAKEDQPVKIEGEEVTMIDAYAERRAKGHNLKRDDEKKKKKKKKPKFEDLEDQLDAEKMAKQRLLFGIASEDDSDDESKEDKSQRKPQIAEGSVYLFQFPPIMPPLHKVDKPNTQKKQAVKDEPEDDDVVMLNAPEHDSSKPVDLTNDDDVKDEEEEDGAAGPNNKNKQLEAEEEPEGFVGKLVIRKSGKMQIDWGGILYDCEMAIPRSFYRECVITEEDDTKQPDGFHGTAYGMGPVMGQFNSAPHWSDEQPWIVDPNDLPPWGSGAAPPGTEMEE